MKFWQAVFFVFLSMLLLVMVLLIRGEPGDWHGLDHPTKQHMSIGGPASERTGDLPWFAAAFGALQIVAFVMLLYAGINTPHSGQPQVDRARNPIRLFFIFSCVIYIGLFLLIFVFYLGEVRNEVDQVAGLPASSWITLFVFWPLPLVYIFFYSVGFQRYIFDSASE
jgi:cytosine/uracil/thiamine/allantoin permease